MTVPGLVSLTRFFRREKSILTVIQVLISSWGVRANYRYRKYSYFAKKQETPDNYTEYLSLIFQYDVQCD